MEASLDGVELSARAYPGTRPFAEPDTAPSANYSMNGVSLFGVCGTQFEGTADYNVPSDGNWGDASLWSEESETTFEAGSIVNVSWCVNADHGGIYSWRLCDDPDVVRKFWADEVPSAADQLEAEACFQRGILRCDDVEDNSCGLEPRCDESWGCAADPGKYFHCQGHDDDTYACANTDETCDSGTLVRRRVKIPDDFPAGPTIMTWRWDSDETTEVFAACSDIVIVAKPFSPTGPPSTKSPSGPPPAPTRSFAPTPVAPTPRPTIRVAEPTSRPADETDSFCCWWAPEDDDYCGTCKSKSLATDWCGASRVRCENCGGSWCNHTTEAPSSLSLVAFVTSAPTSLADSNVSFALNVDEADTDDARRATGARGAMALVGAAWLVGSLLLLLVL